MTGWPHENSSVAQSLQRQMEMISLGIRLRSHTHVSSHTGQVFLKKAAEGKGNPSVKHQSTSVHPRSEVNTLLFFHLLPTARRKLLKRRRAGMALLLGAAQFVYSYSTIRQLTLWCSEDVTDTVIWGCHSPQPSSVDDLLNMYHGKFPTFFFFFFELALMRVLNESKSTTNKIEHTLCCLV